MSYMKEEALEQVPVTSGTAFPFVEAADPGTGWRVVNVPPGQAEADTNAKILKVSTGSTEPEAAARAQELARIAWGRDNDEAPPEGLWPGFIFGAEEARLTACLADSDVEFTSGRCAGTGYVESVVAQAELGSTAPAVAGAVSLVGSGEDEQLIQRQMGRLVSDPARKIARTAEIALKAMACARAALARYTPEQRRLGVVSVAVASDVHRCVEACHEEDKAKEEEQRANDEKRVNGAKQRARSEAESESEPSEDGDEGEGDEGSDDEANPDESGGDTEDDGEGSEGDTPEHPPEDDEGAGDGSPDPDAPPEDGSPDEGEGSDDEGSEGIDADEDAESKPRESRAGSEPSALKPHVESPAEKAAREAREAANEERIKAAERAAAQAEQKAIETERANEAARQSRLESEKARKATDTIERVRAATAIKEEKAAAVAKRDASEGITESREEAKSERGEFAAAFGPAAAEAAKMIETSADQMAAKYGAMLGGFQSGDGTWAAIKTLPMPMPVRVPRIDSPRKRWSDSGAYLRAPQRLFTDGFAFQHNAGGRDGGSVLIDVSGSMTLTNEDIERVVRCAPAVNVAVYAGSTSENQGYLRVVASGGKMVEKQHLSFPFGNNLCDGPALKTWLAKQPMPRIWISDGMVTGSHEGVNPSLMTDCVKTCRAKSIVRVPNVAKAIELFRKINPKVAGLADRYEMEKANGVRA